MRRLSLPARLALVLALAVPFGATTAAEARDSNPVDNFVRRVFGPPHRAKEPPRHRARQGAAKPKPAPAGTAKTAAAPAPAAPAAGVAAGAAAAGAGAAAAEAVPVPSPDPRPEPTGKAAAAPASGGEAKSSETPTGAAKNDSGKNAAAEGGNANGNAVPPTPAPETPAPAPAGGASETTPVPGKPDAVQPAVPAEAKPVEELPVPAVRPADAPPPPAAGGKPPMQGEAGAEPPKVDDAPNSTSKLKGREPVIDPATSVVAAAAVEDAVACEAELKRRGAVFTVEPSISEGECGVLRPIAFERSSSGIKVGPNTQMLCRAALALDTWLADSVVPAAKASFPDRKLTEFRQASTYVCRPRASETGISEHARGSAIDIGSFAFDKGEAVGVAAREAGSPEAKFLDAVRQGACGPFKTVLGPGTDPDHATHFHLDIAARRNGATYCK